MIMDIISHLFNKSRKVILGEEIKFVRMAVSINRNSFMRMSRKKHP